MSRPSRRTIGALHRALLGRDVPEDSAEIADVRSADSLEAALAAVLASDAYQRLARRPTVAEVTLAFEVILDRRPAPDEPIDGLLALPDIGAVVRAIMGSMEYRALASRPRPDDVAALFEVILHRRPAPDEPVDGLLALPDIGAVARALDSSEERKLQQAAVRRTEVGEVFGRLLGRKPDEGAAAALMRLPDMATVVEALLSSKEYGLRHRPGPLWNFTAGFSPVDLILAHGDSARQPRPGLRVNFLGVAADVRAYLRDPEVLERLFGDEPIDGVVEPPPIPSNWHADAAEFAAVLRAVEHAGPSFAMLELGCGWGCWMNNSGVAARRSGRETFLIGVEGDPRHLQFAREALALNGFAPEQFALHRGIAAAEAGTAYFPRQSESGDDWGLQPVFNPTPEQAAEFERQGRHDALPMIPLDQLVGRRDRLDLLHIDIQGGETPLIRDSLAFLDERVAYIVVGTHSRVIDGEIIGILGGAGWELEIERPCLFNLVAGKPVTGIDGVQGWRNPRFPSALDRQP